MDLIEKMVEATEEVIEAEIDFKKIDFSFGEATGFRMDYAKGYAVMPTTLNQVEGGVGFVFFNQGFKISLFEKFYKNTARAQLFNMYEQLAKVFKRLYTIRVTGYGYQVVNIMEVAALAPVFMDTFLKVDINFIAHYRNTKVF